MGVANQAAGGSPGSGGSKRRFADPTILSDPHRQLRFRAEASSDIRFSGMHRVRGNFIQTAYELACFGTGPGGDADGGVGWECDRAVG